MKIALVNFVFMLCVHISLAQNTAGQIVYEKKTNWIKIISKAKYLSKEEKDRMSQTWKNDEDFKEKMILTFNANKSYYTYENQQGESEDGSYTWRKDDYVITKNFETNKLFEIQATLGKTYIIEDSLKFYKWKILNDIKEVNGYICMKATTYDAIKNQKITAWFTTDIAISAGPEQYAGLPGIILEINIDDDTIVIIPLSLTLNKEQVMPQLPKKIKGKKTEIDTFNKTINDYIKQQESLNRYAWGVRF